MKCLTSSSLLGIAATFFRGFSSILQARFDLQITLEVKDTWSEQKLLAAMHYSPPLCSQALMSIRLCLAHDL